MNNFAEGMAAWLIGGVVFLVWSMKRYWKFWLTAFVVFLIYRHFVLGAN